MSFTEIIDSITGTFKDRTRNPFFFTFILVWIFAHHQSIYDVCFSSQGYDVKVHQLNTIFTFHFWPLVGYIFLTFVILFVSYMILAGTKYCMTYYNNHTIPYLVDKATKGRGVVLAETFNKLETAYNTIMSKYTQTLREKNEARAREKDLETERDQALISKIQAQEAQLNSDKAQKTSEQQVTTLTTELSNSAMRERETQLDHEKQMEDERHRIAELINANTAQDGQVKELLRDLPKRKQEIEKLTGELAILKRGNDSIESLNIPDGGRVANEILLSRMLGENQKDDLSSLFYNIDNGGRVDQFHPALDELVDNNVVRENPIGTSLYVFTDKGKNFKALFKARLRIPNSN